MSIRIKEIPNCKGYYIQDDGKVVSNLKKGARSKDSVEDTFHEIKPRYGKNGYMRVYLREDVNNTRKDFYVHRLVADAFLENSNPDEYTCVNHKDCNRWNNSYENLE